MIRLTTSAWFWAVLGAVVVCLTNAHATDIGGTISTTLTITEDSQLVDDVTCTVTGAPCISIVAPTGHHVTLELNGFTMTGPADPPMNCTSIEVFLKTPEDGIMVDGQHDVAVLGPGLVQKFRRHGIRLLGSSKVQVMHVTASDNCFSGIILTDTTDSDIEDNVSVRNAAGSAGAACGGT